MAGKQSARLASQVPAMHGLSQALYTVSGLPTGSKVVPCLWLPYRILNMNHKQELPWSLWVGNEGVEDSGFRVEEICDFRA